MYFCFLSFFLSAGFAGIKNLSHILAVSGAWNDTFLAFSGPWNQEKPFWSFQGPEMKLFWHFQGPEMAPFWLFQAPEIRWSLFGVIRGLKLSYFGIFRGLKWHLIGWKRWYSEIILTQLTNRFIANCWTYPGPQKFIRCSLGLPLLLLLLLSVRLQPQLANQAPAKSNSNKRLHSLLLGS